MRHVFILNPVAGKVRAALSLRDTIESYFSAHPEKKYTVYLTDEVGAATRIARAECEKGDAVRLYACGGDGTLQETAAGVPMGDNRVEIAVIPCGSGNDYVRSYGDMKAFCDLTDVIEGSAIPVDAVDCGDAVSLNIASLGMDAKVCARMTRYKYLPGVSGSMAYTMAIGDVFCHPIGDEMEITVEGENGTEKRSGKFLMALAANGQYYGGGWRGAPQAVTDDGVLDFVLVRKISRFHIPYFLKKYKVGDYGDLPYCEHLRGFAMTVKSKLSTYCNVDGECTCSNEMRFSLLKKAFYMVLPRSVLKKRSVATAEC